MPHYPTSHVPIAGARIERERVYPALVTLRERVGCDEDECEQRAVYRVPLLPSDPRAAGGDATNLTSTDHLAFCWDHVYPSFTSLLRAAVEHTDSDAPPIGGASPGFMCRTEDESGGSHYPRGG